MARDYVINGETLVKVKFGAHVLGPSGASNLTELGLSSEAIRITPIFRHKDVRTEDFGPDMPADELFMLAGVGISMKLIHFDHSGLITCMNESMAGSKDGTLVGAGTPMRGFKGFLASGYHYVSLNLLSERLNLPWRFPAARLAENPLVMPIGTQKSMADLNWKCIPFFQPSTVTAVTSIGSSSIPGEVKSSGAVLWDRTLDT